jgi:anti-anti-sigma factor
MQIQTSVANGFTMVKVLGRIDSVTANDFESKLQTLIENGIPKIVIDCSQVDYISSAGLRAYLVIQKEMATKGSLVRLCCLQPSIREIFDICGFSAIFPIYPDVASAISG